uniref:Uncharacterized protein n=1 Tax=Meloidogyne enterolobii TaxID=390850 RepID=A0A6V7WSB8_MELEN|nr:unnamed protein product [Meloidogyne enterolobii]
MPPGFRHFRKIGHFTEKPILCQAYRPLDLTFRHRVFWFHHLQIKLQRPPGGTLSLSLSVPEISSVPTRFRYKGIEVPPKS